MEKNSINRRDWLKKSLKSATALGTLGLIGGFDVKRLYAQTEDSAEILNFETQAVCQLTCSQTLGPCYAPNPLVRQDITSGKTGLPMRLGFRIVDTDCNPVPNALIDIWHTDTNGVYSALAGFCANGDANAPSQNFLRGVQSTDSDGWAYFDTIYPGWYPSRTAHIHATIRVGTTAMVTTQFYFLDRISKFIYKNHPLYLHRPTPQTINTTDNILGGNLTRMMPYIFSTKYQPKRTFNAWKTVVIGTTPTTCNA